MAEKYKTSKAALAQALIEGCVISIKTCFREFGITNCPREISRAIEKPFGVIVSRTKQEGHTRYGKQYCTWHDYHLNTTKYNKPGIEKMKDYVAKNTITKPKLKPLATAVTQSKLF